MSEHLELPLAPIQRIVKAALPPGATVAKEVKQSLGKAAALFILYLTSTANDVCKQHRRLTVSGEDVLAALEEIEFDMFLEPLQAYLMQYRDETNKKRKPRAAPASGEGGVPKKRRMSKKNAALAEALAVASANPTIATAAAAAAGMQPAGMPAMNPAAHVPAFHAAAGGDDADDHHADDGEGAGHHEEAADFDDDDDDSSQDN